MTAFRRLPDPTARASCRRLILLPGQVRRAVLGVAPDDDTGLQLYAFPLDGKAPLRGGRLTLDTSARGAPPRLRNVTAAVRAGDRLVLLSEGEAAAAAYRFRTG
ncbi:hypothetical protein AB0D42_21140 [Streptomyces sp. NPDC048304]|uniref:hypothetical protein n=1 Tax=Streptomyces sp. NPDC048304 TaxID=3154820 RepID=UPI0033C3D199